MLRTRETLERNEELVLAPWASRAAASRGRRHPEPEHPSRTSFQRDRDRIVHATAFRRLEYKTQVFVHHEGDHYRNRLTHSLEVAQIARGVARVLGLNEDLTEAVALAHDLGHPPFGHAGERVLDGVMRDFGGFEHNRQSLRVVEVVEHRYAAFRGLNLTWETREGLAKHRVVPAAEGDGDYPPGVLPSLEAQVVNLVDEIAYTAHDLDDGMTSDLLSFRSLADVPLWREAYGEAERDLPGAPARLVCARAIRQIIDLLVRDCVATTVAAAAALGVGTPDAARGALEPVVRLSPEVEVRFHGLKGFLDRELYHHYRVRRMELKAERILGRLFAAYTGDPELLPPTLRAHLEGNASERIICDWIAGMTDRFAVREYQKLFEFTEGL